MAPPNTHSHATPTRLPPGPESPRRARHIMIGGFLGAGKTTALAALGRRLADQGLRVGLITNDQGRNLVDTAMLRARGFATEEIPGGCFCCRFQSLVDASRKLTAETRPDVFVAEPVGSCTDLIATVSYPLRRIYGDAFTIAPLSVLVDPVRALRAFGLERGGTFSGKVLYIFLKQIEEADLLVISKSDLVDAARLDRLRGELAARYPRAEVLTVSARTGLGLDAWFDRLMSGEQSQGATMDVDYDTYAEGEALLGWLNATVQVRALEGFEANGLMEALARAMQARLAAAGAEIAHLKMTFSPEHGLGEVSALSLVRNDFVPELTLRLDGAVSGGELIVNLRAEAPPELLAQALEETLAGVPASSPGTTASLQHLEHFRPGRPTPSHRDRA